MFSLMNVVDETFIDYHVIDFLTKVENSSLTKEEYTRFLSATLEIRKLLGLKLLHCLSNNSHHLTGVALADWGLDDDDNLYFNYYHVDNPDMAQEKLCFTSAKNFSNNEEELLWLKLFFSFVEYTFIADPNYRLSAILPNNLSILGKQVALYTLLDENGKNLVLQNRLASKVNSMSMDELKSFAKSLKNILNDC